MPRLSDALGQVTPPVSTVHKAASLLPPPPRQRSGAPQSMLNTPMVPTAMQEDEPLNVFSQPQDQVLHALSQQSTALTALVAHLAGGGDQMWDLGNSMAASSTGTRGLMKRERMVSELAGRTSSFFLQYQQQLSRRLNPSIPVPKTLEEMKREPPSLLSYLEKQGFKGQRSLGLVLWMLGYALDAAGRDDFHMTKEHLTLAAVAIEQCCIDGGDWGLAFLLSLAAFFRSDIK